MIFNYGTNNFKILRNNLNSYFYRYSTGSICTEKEREFINNFNDILKDEYISKLVLLDRKQLTFHKWLNINETTNGNLLSDQNKILINIANGESPNYDFGKKVIEALYLVLYADIYEASIIMKNTDDLEYFRLVIDRLNLLSTHLSSTSFEQLTRLWFIVPKEVFTRHLDKHFDSEFIRTVDLLQNNEKFIEEKSTISNALKNDIIEIRSSLDQQKSEYNFVGLSNGFRTLKEQKKNELKWQSAAYYILMLIIISLIAIKSTWSTYYLSANELNNPVFIIITISTILFLFILLYFFKISLVNVRSIKSQILQIDLRLTLCQFIHNYDADTKGLREGMKESFERFESVIFSPIVATEDQMPATFDGLEQLTGILGSFNKGSK